MRTLKQLILALLFSVAAHAQLQTISDASLPAAVGGGAWTGHVIVKLNNPASAQPLLYGSTPLLGFQHTVCIGEVRSDCNSTVAAGTLVISLYANTTITPVGTSYNATFIATRGGSLGNETWTVHVGDTSLAQIRSTTVPSPSTLFQESQLRLTAGSIPYGASTGLGTELALGTSGYLLSAGLTAPQWIAIPACATCLLSSGSYADPSWLTSLAGSKVTGAVPSATLAAAATALATPLPSMRIPFGQGTGIPATSANFLFTEATATAPAVISTGMPSLTREHDKFGRYYLRNWQSQLAKFSAGTASQTVPASVVVIGDSWVAGSTITQPMRLFLQSQFGNGGPGWCPAGNFDGTPFGIALTTTGTWTNTNSTSAIGIDGYDSYSVDTATPAKKEWYGVAQAGVLYYVVQPGGGSFRYRVDAGSWTTVATAGTLALGTATISGQTNAYHTFTVELVSAGSSNVKILGWNLTNEAQGVVVHRVGHSGATSAFYEALSAGTLWDDQLTALNPSAVIISLAVNDMNSVITPAAYLASMKAFTEAIRAAVPNADVLFYTQGDSGLTQSPYTLADYHYRLEDYARVASIGFIDTYKRLGAYGTNANGFWAGNQHPNTVGGYAMAHMINGFLTDGLAFRFGNQSLASTVGTADSGWAFDIPRSGVNGTLHAYNQAATGTTFVKIRESSAQSSGEVLGIYSNDELTSRLSVKYGNLTLRGDGSDTGYGFAVLGNGTGGTAEFYNPTAGGATKVYIREGPTQSTTVPFGVYRNNGTTCALCVTSVGLSVATSSVFTGYALGVNGSVYLSGGDLNFGDTWVMRAGTTTGVGFGAGHRMVWASGSFNTSAGPSGDTATGRYGVGKLAIDSGTAIGTTPGNARDLVNRRTYAVEAVSDPSAADLTIAGSNAQDVAAIYTKNDKLVIAYNRSGTVTYLTIPLDGSTTTFTQSTSAP